MFFVLTIGMYYYMSMYVCVFRLCKDGSRTLASMKTRSGQYAARFGGKERNPRSYLKIKANYNWIFWQQLFVCSKTEKIRDWKQKKMNQWIFTRYTMSYVCMRVIKSLNKTKSEERNKEA